MATTPWGLLMDSVAVQLDAAHHCACKRYTASRQGPSTLWPLQADMASQSDPPLLHPDDESVFAILFTSYSVNLGPRPESLIQ